MRSRSLFAIVIGLSLLSAGASAQRLPQNVIPSRYDLTFTPDLKAATFTGEEAIDVTVAQPSNTITMNSAEIKVNEVAITVGKESFPAKISYDEGKEQVTFTTQKPVPAGAAKIGIRFVGILNNDLRGFYLSKSRLRNYATTQFESTDARRAFPCFDEPAFKATFDIKIIADKGDTAFSNGKQMSDVPGPGPDKHTVTFARTAKMSTYLVAMVVGDLVCQSGEVDGIPLRVCSTPDKEPLLGFALEGTQKIVHFYNGYYGIKYPFAKLDQLGIPDFSAGAMENTAAITYRETALLLDAKTGTTNNRKGVAGTIAHEIAHQWFGDLVTMKWWDDIWLNEGFATWMAPKPLEAWHPEWHEELDEVQGTQEALRLDALASTRPIHQDANTPAEIEALFDGIAYGKTAAVLRMIEHYVGDEAFRKGVNNYLEHHKYGNTEAKDFWSEIATASGKPVDQIMPTFVNQAGAPIVIVKQSCANGKTELRLSQKRLFVDPAMAQKTAEQVWQIPVCVKTLDARGKSCQVMTRKEQTLSLPACSDWAFVNADGNGYYRTQYDDADIKKLGTNESALSPAERISFLGDQWAFVNGGEQKVGTFLELLQSFQKERSRAVMQSVLGPIQYLDERVVTDKDRAAFDAWVKQLLQPVVKEIGMKPQVGEESDRGVMRIGVLYALGKAGDEQVLAYLRQVLDGYMKDATSVPADQVPIAFELSAIHGDRALYEQFLARRAAAKTPTDLFRYQDNLTAFRDPELIKQTLEFTLTKEVRTQDLSRMLAEEFGNPAARDETVKFFKEHFEEIRQKTVAELGSGFGGVIANFCESEKVQDLSQFMESKKLQGWARGIRQGKERANTCIRFRQSQSESLTGFLHSHAGD